MFAHRRGRAFTLIEVVAAVTVLALIVSTSLSIIGRCLEASVNLRTRMVAFSLARENMEKLLGATSVAESVDYGDSNDVAGVTWETRVEPFYDPHMARMWIRAVSSAFWRDTNGEIQTIEFTQWLTDLSQQETGKILDRQRQQEQALDEYALADIRGLFRKAVSAHNAAGMEGYEEMVAACRQLIQDYPNTAAASGAKVLLHAMPSAEQQKFDIKPYETTQAALPPDSGTGLSDVGQSGLGDAGIGQTPDNRELIGGYTMEQLNQLFIDDQPKFMRVIMELLSGKK